MADVFSPLERSEIMSRITGKNTAPELIVRRVVHALGYRFRLHRAELPGKPDIVLVKQRKVIFVHGCFWHGHARCKRAALPTSNVPFWISKISKNKARDRRIKAKLRRTGWRILEIWQCQLKDPDRLAANVIRFLGKKRPVSRAKKQTHVVSDCCKRPRNAR